MFLFENRKLSTKAMRMKNFKTSFTVIRLRKHVKSHLFFTHLAQKCQNLRTQSSAELHLKKTATLLSLKQTRLMVSQTKDFCLFYSNHEWSFLTVQPIVRRLAINNLFMLVNWVTCWTKKTLKWPSEWNFSTDFDLRLQFVPSFFKFFTSNDLKFNNKTHFKWRKREWFE